MVLLQEVRAFEFSINTATLAVDAHLSLGKIAKQLQERSAIHHVIAT